MGNKVYGYGGQPTKQCVRLAGVRKDEVFHLGKFNPWDECDGVTPETELQKVRYSRSAAAWEVKRVDGGEWRTKYISPAEKVWIKARDKKVTWCN